MCRAIGKLVPSNGRVQARSDKPGGGTGLDGSERYPSVPNVNMEEDIFVNMSLLA